MPLDESYPRAVVFIVAEIDDGSSVRKSPVGTGFIVAVPSESMADQAYLYVVTAAHVVRPYPRAWVRLNTKNGGVTDLAVAEWFFHPTEDVAVTPAVLNPDHLFSYVPLSSFLDRFDAAPNLGDRAYFLGLLGRLTAMADANIPMVRSGTIGRLNQTEIPMQQPDGTVFRMTGHLIDCRSYGGFSGSPCFVQFTVVREVTEPSIPGGAIGNLAFEETLLLGLVSGHFDDWARARLSGDILTEGTIETAVNTGVGVVVPVERIRETLNLQELIDARSENDAMYGDLA